MLATRRPDATLVECNPLRANTSICTKRKLGRSIRPRIDVFHLLDHSCPDDRTSCQSILFNVEV